MGGPEKEDLRPEDLARGIIHRKPVSRTSAVGMSTDDPGRIRPDGLMWPSKGFEASQFNPAGEVAAFANFFHAIRRRWRRASLRARVAFGVVMIAAAVILGGVAGGGGGDSQSVVPKGAAPVATRSIDQWTLRVYASPYKSPGWTSKEIDVSYEAVASGGAVMSSASVSVGGPGNTAYAGGLVVDEGWTFGGGINGGPCQVTNPAITVVHLVAARHVLDSMTPVAYDSVRFVVLDTLKVPSAANVTVQGLGSDGRVLSSASIPSAL